MDNTLIRHSGRNLLSYRNLPVLKIIWFNQFKRSLKEATPAIIWAKKRGKRSGWKVRLSRQGTKTPLPAILLTNACSLSNKIDELWSLLSSNRLKYTAVLAVVETWLKPETSDAQIALTGFTIHWADPTIHSGKAKGGGIAIYLNDSWSSNSIITATICNHDVEMLSFKCRSFWLPRELSCILIVGVYCPPSSNAIQAVKVITADIDQLERKHLHAAIMVLGDFNHIELKLKGY